MRLRSEAFSWLGTPISPGWVELFNALPRPPTLLLAEAAMKRFHPSSLRMHSVARSGGYVSDRDRMSSSSAQLRAKTVSLTCTLGVGGFRGRCHQPALSRAGILYIPRDTSSVVHSISTDGSFGKGVDFVAAGMEGFARVVAVDNFSDLFFVITNNDPAKFLGAARDAKRTPRLVALRLSKIEGEEKYGRQPVWTLSSPFFTGKSYGLVVMPPSIGGKSYLVLALHTRRKLVVLNALDGRIVQSLDTDSAPVSLACDPPSLSVYVTLDNARPVARFVWDDGALAFHSSVESAHWAGTDSLGGSYPRALAVVPAGPGCRLSHLIISCKSTLLVIAIPSHKLVHKTECSGRDIVGMTADSSMALVICSSSSARDSSGRTADAASVVAWPLCGMPPLE